ncbi:MAG: hypothetical protein JOZ49_05200 [Mycolicibacterium sp.]|nr:hypothetical protein [Mycolicibacterium sp.]
MTNETMEQQKATAFVTPTQMRWLTFGFSLVALLSAAFGAGWVSHSVTTAPESVIRDVPSLVAPLPRDLPSQGVGPGGCSEVADECNTVPANPQWADRPGVCPQGYLMSRGPDMSPGSFMCTRDPSY